MSGIPKNKERLGEGSHSKEKSEERPNLSREEEKQGAKEVSSSGGQTSPFVRNYRGKNSAGANGAYRMSMTIRPQTVANLASKFDTIVKDQQPASKNSKQGLKLRSYDITKIISELNKLNNEGDQSCVKSKPKPGKNENHLPCDGSSGGSSGTVGDNRRNLCGLGGDSRAPSHAKTTASQPEAALRPNSTALKKTAEESHNNRGRARQDAVGPVGSCRLPTTTSRGSKICENNPALGRNADGSSRRTSVEETAPVLSPSLLPASSLPASSLPASSLANRSRKESRKGLAVSFSPEQQVWYTKKKNVLSNQTVFTTAFENAQKRLSQCIINSVCALAQCPSKHE